MTYLVAHVVVGGPEEVISSPAEELVLCELLVGFGVANSEFVFVLEKGH
jgi:hypothetical protein